MKAPYLIVDCYVNDPDGASGFGVKLEGHSWHSIRAIEGVFPDDLNKFQGVLITGSAASVLEPPPWIAGLLELIRRAKEQKIPVLGICFGHQVVAAALGAELRLAPQPEVGWVELKRIKEDPLLRGVESTFHCFVSHEDEVISLPENLIGTVRSNQCSIHAFRAIDAPVWGLQFHPEMSMSEAKKLVYWRAERHPECGIDPEKLISQSCPADVLAKRIFGNFLALSQP